MSHNIIQLSIEGELLRGVRLVEDGVALSREDESSWSFAKVEVEEGEEEDERDYVTRLAEAFIAAKKHFRTKEVSLSVPLSQMLVKVVKLPASERELMNEAVGEQMTKISPFPDEDLAVGVEVVRETDSDIYVAVGALPESVSLDIGEALNIAKLRVVRTDATMLGWMSSLWSEITAAPPAARRMVLADLDGEGWDAIVLDDDAPVVIRGIGKVDAATLEREATLTLLDAEFSAGVRPLGEIALVSRGEVSAEVLSSLKNIAEVREIKVVDEWLGVEGSARRGFDDSTLDITPLAWTQALNDSRFIHKLYMGLAVAGGIWVILTSIMFGGPIMFDYLKGRTQNASKAHKAEYQHVNDVRSRVRVIKRYSNRSRSAIEMLREACICLPEGVTLTSFSYVRENDAKGDAKDPKFEMKVDAEAVDYQSQYEFKDFLSESDFFDTVEMNRSRSKGGMQMFSLDASATIKEGE